MFKVTIIARGLVSISHKPSDTSKHLRQATLEADKSYQSSTEAKTSAKEANLAAEGSRAGANELRYRARGAVLSANEQRKQAEGTRLSANEQRKQAAGTRLSANEQRKQAAGTRLNAGTLRSQAAGARLNAETQRSNAIGSELKAQGLITTEADRLRKRADAFGEQETLREKQKLFALQGAYGVRAAGLQSDADTITALGNIAIPIYNLVRSVADSANKH